jgi:hypothetical protein
MAISRSNANVFLSLFYSAIVALPVVLNHPLKRLDPIQRHRNELFSVDFTENSAFGAFEGLSVRKTDSLDVLFQKAKEEEATRGQV